MNCSKNKQLTYIKWITISFLIIGFALSPKLWVGDRLFPHIPVFDRWAFQELKVPVYPEYRVFRKIMKYFCRYDIPEGDLMFLVYKQPVLEENLVKCTCSSFKF